MRDLLEKEIKSVLVDFGVKNPKVVLDTPVRINMGDLSTNVAMSHAKELGERPVDLANRIKEVLRAKDILHLARVDVIEPGFINFFFDADYFARNVSKILDEKDTYGKNKKLNGQKTIIEYTDPNPFKEFHIGHLMSNTIGESVSRVLEANGTDIKRANYQGDVGLHIAKAIWAMKWMPYKNDKSEIPNENESLPKKTKFLGEIYAFGDGAYVTDSTGAGNEIIEINKQIYNKSDPEINKLYEMGRRWSLEYFENIYKKLGTKFDFYFFESEVGDFGKEVVEKNIGKVFEKSDGAIVFKGENFDKTLHTRVFINKEGLPTYEAKELGLSKIKYDKYPYDLSVIITGNEINEYFRVLLKALSMIFPELAQKTRHLSHGMLRLKEGKMSSRTGNIITAENLVDNVRGKVLEIMKEADALGSSKGEDESIAEIISIAAIKYSILRQAIGGDIIFDFDKSISFMGDSGPYLQYSVVRAQSVLKRAQFSISDFQFSIPKDWQTTNLERLLERFPDVVARAGAEYAPHHIVTYLVDLAGEFNSFYASHKIIDTEDPTSPYRLALTQAFAQVMTSGLNLLGIKVPERM